VVHAEQHRSAFRFYTSLDFHAENHFVIKGKEENGEIIE